MLSPKSGELYQPSVLRREVRDLRVGARLRGVEVTVDGRVERRSGGPVLLIGGTKGAVRLTLQPLTSKVQLDPRRRLPQPATSEEREAYRRLCAELDRGSSWMRVVGPLVASGSGLTLQVREFVAFSPARAETLEVTLGVDVNDPYGLGSSWVTLRDGIRRLAVVEDLNEEPDRPTATFALRTRGRLLPDPVTLSRAVAQLGAGARVRGVEVTVDGWLVDRGRRLVRDPFLPDDGLPLASLTQRVQLAGPRDSSRLPRRAERRAHARLVAEWRGRPVRARVTGPLQILGERSFLLEVRAYEMRPTSFASNRRRLAVPDAPRVLFARSAGDSGVRLDWDDAASSAGGFNIYQLCDDGSRRKVNDAPILASPFTISRQKASRNAYYVVAAVSDDGGESESSPPASAAPPAPPAGLTVTADGRALRLDWDASSEPDVDAYNVFRSTKSRGPFVQIAAGVTTTSHTDSGADHGVTYYYVVTATDGSTNSSEPSPVAAGARE